MIFNLKRYSARKYTEEMMDEDIKDIVRDYWVPVKSSFITAIAYYEPLRILEVKIGGNTTTYKNVPPEVYNDFMKSESKGKFYNTVIKKRFDQR